MIRTLAAWLRVQASGYPIAFSTLWAMHSRQSPVSLIADCYIVAKKAEEKDVPPEGLECHFMAGGRLEEVVLSLIVARNAGESLEFGEACEMDLLLRGRQPAESLLEQIRALVKREAYTREALWQIARGTAADS